MILLTLGGAYLCISLLVLGVGGESLRLSVTRWQCLMVLVAGLLPFLCSLFQLAAFSRMPWKEDGAMI